MICPFISGTVPQIELHGSTRSPEINILGIIIKDIDSTSQAIPDSLEAFVMICLESLLIQPFNDLMIMADPNRSDALLRMLTQIQIEVTWIICESPTKCASKEPDSLISRYQKRENVYWQNQ